MSETSRSANPMRLDPQTVHQADVCVHCGLCLPACPTYTENGDENDSPRGRIVLMKSLHEGRLSPDDAVVKHLDLCLDCRGCETACPSGVIYHELIEETRARLAEQRKPAFDQRLVDWITRQIMTQPARLKLALLPARLLQRLGVWRTACTVSGALLGPRLGKMMQMLPTQGKIWPPRLAEHYPASGETKVKVGLLGGCVGSVLFESTNRRAIELMTHLGCDVTVPRAQACCGAIHHHGGDPATAAEMAKRNIEAFEDCEFVVNHIAGCGAMLKEYDHLLRDDANWAGRSQQFVAKVRDVSELLVELDPPPPPHRVPLTATYHDACHLAHAQKITDEPRRLLNMIEGLTLRPLPEADMCCGAAGTYNLQQPEMSGDLARRKLAHIQSTGASICVTGNVGCAMQIQSQADQAGLPLEVMHPIDLLHRAYLGAPSEQSV